VRIHQHVTAYSNTGVFAAWPANRGLWCFGPDLLLGFTVARWTGGNAPSDHCFDAEQGTTFLFARSGDGGRSWFTQGVRVEHRNHGPLDFFHPGFGLATFMESYTGGTSSYYVTTDAGETWNGPFALPCFGRFGVMARQDHVVNGKHDLSIFLTVLKDNLREGVPLHVRTRDGGLSWTLEGQVCPDPLRGFAIMPATVRCGHGYVSAVRVSDGQGGSGIEIRRSNDHGKHWEHVSFPVHVQGRGNPPTLNRTPDGKGLLLCYGHRQAPYGIRAKVSKDYGRSWGPEIILRDDLPDWDCGYPRTHVNGDGTILTAYYVNRRSEQRATIEATLWEL
jgi:hypothetical protein